LIWLLMSIPVTSVGVLTGLSGDPSYFLVGGFSEVVFA
jgi:hypothetical protein